MIGSTNLFAVKRRRYSYVLGFIAASAHGGKWHDAARWQTMLSRFAVCSYRRRAGLAEFVFQYSRGMRKGCLGGG